MPKYQLVDNVVDLSMLNLHINSLILVAVMTDPRDLEIARVLGWYRIPLRSAPKVVAVDYLAFYQTAAFADEKWRIQYIAPVWGHELTTRGELFRDQPDHPHAAHEYYKIQLGPIERLPEPIMAEKWRRVTFLYTTGEYFLQARTLNDLIVASEERRVLWQALRERANQSQNYQLSGNDDLPVDPGLLAALLGIQDAGGSYKVDQREIPTDNFQDLDRS